MLARSAIRKLRVFSASRSAQSATMPVFIPSATGNGAKFHTPNLLSVGAFFTLPVIAYGATQVHRSTTTTDLVERKQSDKEGKTFFERPKTNVCGETSRSINSNGAFQRKYTTTAYHQYLA